MPADPFQIEIESRPDGVELSVKVVPGAARTKVVCPLEKALKIAVSAPAEGGKANTAVVKLLAARFGLKRRDVEIVAGKTQPRKQVRLKGLSEREARRRLAEG